MTALGLVPVPPNAPDHRHNAYQLKLTGLTQDVLAMTVPLTFTFAKAGTATISAKIRPHGERDDVFAESACLA